MNGGNLMWLVDGTNRSIDSLNKTDNFIVSSNDLNLNIYSLNMVLELLLIVFRIYVHQ